MKMNGLYLGLSLYGLLAALLALVLSSGQSNWLLFGFGQLSLPALLLVPSLLSRPIKVTDPLNLLLIGVIIGTVLQSALLAFGDSPARTFLMADWTVDDYATGSLWVMLSLFIIGTTYSLTTKRIKIRRFLPSAKHFSAAGVSIGVLIGILVSLFALVTYLKATGGFSLSEISRKRTVEFISNGQVVYAGGGYSQLFANISRYMLLILLGFFLQRKKRLGIANTILLVLMFLLAAALPFFSSSRGSLLQILFGALYVFVAFRNVTWRSLLLAALIPTFIFGAMTGLRSAYQGRTSGFHIENPLLTMAESGNGLAIGSTTAVLYGVPERMPYQLGSTLTSWIFAPIPRSIWPGKPETALGRRIKEEIYHIGALRNGFPASFMAEGYINFGWLGFLLFSALFGFGLRLIANSFAPLKSATPTAPVLYYIVASNFVGLSNINLSLAAIRFGMDLFAFLFAYMLLRYIIARQPSHRRSSPLATAVDA
ncbi:oligosaccharide repeat unit polymerase [Sinirhodobacter ferrireducens]|uniref:Oligosaccharide repeat unit polymerase n=1 Tax=Paenirhodobacter ferrireducens TaxID=1215032 RepID=A0A443L533_9RHOB|nr:O-antigen polymerase [Sinirhodobacter ferrireducens]RWR44276.1 oligosaccharide repeat unit polymerase [Sinirhodobacter ferrireducens]